MQTLALPIEPGNSPHAWDKLCQDHPNILLTVRSDFSPTLRTFLVYSFWTSTEVLAPQEQQNLAQG